MRGGRATESGANEGRRRKDFDEWSFHADSTGALAASLPPHALLTRPLGLPAIAATGSGPRRNELRAKSNSPTLNAQRA